MMQDDVKNYELLSALVDGQLGADECAAVLQWVGAEEAARQRWHAYHLVGDVLRSGEAAVGAADITFVQRLKLRLEREQVTVQSVKTPDVPSTSQGAGPTLDVSRTQDRAANDRYFRGKLLAAVASLAAVMVIGWQTLSVTGDAVGPSQLVRVQVQAGNPGFALQQPQSGEVQEPEVMIRDAHLDSLLAAHRQVGGTSALQMPTGFLRNATFEGTAR